MAAFLGDNTKAMSRPGEVFFGELVAKPTWLVGFFFSEEVDRSKLFGHISVLVGKYLEEKYIKRCNYFSYRIDYERFVCIAVGV